jgi:hypothetical protein
MKYVKYPQGETLNMGGIADYRMTGIYRDKNYNLPTSL